MVKLFRNELDIIFEWLKSQITPKDKQWLEKEWPGIWEKGKTIKESAIDIKKRSRVFLSITIGSIIDSKFKKKAVHHRPVEGLAILDLIQIACWLEIPLPKTYTGRELSNLILKKIKAP